MQLDDYQEAARQTAIYVDRHRVVYPALGLASRAGIAWTSREAAIIGSLDQAAGRGGAGRGRPATRDQRGRPSAGEHRNGQARRLAAPSGFGVGEGEGSGS